jgi:ribonuclease R
MELEEEIINFLGRKKSPVSFRQLYHFFQRRGIKKSELRKALSSLEEKDRLIQLERRKYDLPQRADIAKGIFQPHPRGYAFVLTENEDIFIPPGKSGGALPGDEVIVQCFDSGKRSREGKVLKVLKRKRDTLVAQVEKWGKKKVAIPTDPRVFYSVVLEGERKVLPGEVVVVQIEDFPKRKSRLMKGKVVEVLGGEDNPRVLLEILVREHGLPLSFPSKVKKEAQSMPLEIRKTDLKGRKDYRSEFTVTIDGLDAKDFDDAVSVERIGEKYKFKVHIADVSYYVKRGSYLDKEARERAFSAYLVDRVIPMLPPELSNGICSLNPQVERLTMSVEMVVNTQGEVEDFQFHPGVIRSCYRLTYEEVDKYFSSGRFPDKKVETLLLNLKELTDILEEKRRRRGSLLFERPEAKVLLDEEGNPVEIKLRERTEATKIIEEAMILTNETVASFLYNLGYPCIYRVHEKPDQADLIELRDVFQELSLPVKSITSGHPGAFQKIIEIAKKRADKYFINTLLLRAMKQARYSAKPESHFGLASPIYTHFTSPIRRYPDLVVHRILKRAISDEFFSKEEMEVFLREFSWLSEEISAKEREIEEAERESVEIKICEYMKKNCLGEVFTGVISGVTRYGLFVELPNTAEGRVSLSSMSDFYRFEEDKHRLVGEKTGRVFKLGQEVKVKLVNVSVSEKRMDFVLVEPE